MNEAFNTGFQLNKCAVIGDVGDTALVDRTQRIGFLDCIPRIGLQLLHAQGDAVGFLVDLDDLHFDSLTNGKDFRRVVDAAPSHVSDVQQAVYAADRLMPALDNITWERVEREDHVTYPTDAPDQPGRDVVFDKGFPRPGGFGKLVAAKLTPPDETPDHDYPFILTTGRQLEHWHTGAMTRRASVLDALEPSAVASVSRGTLERLGLKPGDRLRVTTRRGTVDLASRQDDAIPDGVVFIPFAFVEAAANILTNPALDPFGKIPEFKFCAAKVEPATPRQQAAESPRGIARHATI